ncbi:DUF6233 domain-containing protein [Streptomyces sp. NPDC057616]|uniref:DUF6233 domain-containing protein n=1 Tax=Streptomyces sp. NPDC057616 TaxID=3346183 RepID=UPI0036C5F407
MNELPPDLPRLRTLETWLQLQLKNIRQAITSAERQEAEQQRGRQARPPAPDWLLERGLNPNNPPLYVHVGDCTMAGKRVRPVDRGTARRALIEGIPACGHCRPDNALGILD